MSAAWEAVDRALARLEAGHGSALAQARALVASLPDAGERRAWSLAAGAAAWLWGDGEQAAPDPGAAAAIGQDGSPSARRAALRICAAGQRAALLDADPAAHGRWVAAHRALAEPADPALRLALGWQALLAGERPIEPATAARAAATRVREPAALVEATALCALARLAAGEIPQALVLARRAALMARSETLPEAERLAGLVLARVRRHAGRPHLAVHLLAALAGSVTGRWRGRIAWELMLAQGRWGPLLGDGAGMGGPAGQAVSALRALLEAAAAGERARFDDAAGRLAGMRADPGALCALLRFDAEAVLAAVDARPPRDGALAAWARGETAQVPPALHGLACVDPARPPGAASHALVLARPGQPGHRLLPIGAPLHERAQVARARLPETEERTLAALAALALAGPAGHTPPEFFARVYGFPYAPEVHGGTLRVLLHRARRAVADLGEIAPEGERIALRLAAPALLPDPRCAEPAEARVIAYLAFAGETSTERAAAALGLPVRTTRALLQRVVADGLCRMVREGRQVTYRVEDSVVSALTPITSLLSPGQRQTP